VVATARNDNHGGNLLGRMQIFVSALINQARRHNLPCELILVEWNPPADKPKLAEALRWPDDPGPCTVRIIEVPNEVHSRYQFAATLPLYQMIAKNVGIRRARGEFVLVTNIDVILSDEMMRFFAQRKLERGRMYRVDRTDVAADVPVDAPVDQQVAWCRGHVIRLCARDGIFKLTPEGLRQQEPKDITRPDSGIWFGTGWYEVERYMVDHFRWIRDGAEMFLRVPPKGGILNLEMEPGPGVGVPPQPLHVLDEDGNTIAEWMISGRATVRLGVPASPGQALRRIQFVCPTGGGPVSEDPRIMNFRFYRCDWIESDTDMPGASAVSGMVTLKNFWRTLARLAFATLRSNGISRALPAVSEAFRLMRARGADIFDAAAEFQIGSGWHYLEHIGAQKVRWVDNHAQLTLRFSDTTSSLGLLLEPGPWIDYQPFDLVVRSQAGEVLARTRVNGLACVEIPLPVEQGRWLGIVLSAEGVASRDRRVLPGDGRPLNFRIFACGRGRQRKLTQLEKVVAGEWNSRVVGFSPPEVDWREKLGDCQREIAYMGKPRFLHLYACGDFQLMAREHWIDLRGYAELDQFSMHLDSHLSYAADSLGLQEEILEAPMQCFHVEHAVGTGWTPEGYKELSQRIAKKGIQQITFSDLAEMVAQMRQLHGPLIFNLDDWGLAGIQFAETTPAPSRTEQVARP
jgi:hypothetical protein